LTAIRAPRRLALQDFEERLCPFEPPLSAVGESVPLKLGDDRSICAHRTAGVDVDRTFVSALHIGGRTSCVLLVARPVLRRFAAGQTPGEGPRATRISGIANALNGRQQSQPRGRHVGVAALRHG